MIHMRILTDMMQSRKKSCRSFRCAHAVVNIYSKKKPFTTMTSGVAKNVNQIFGKTSGKISWKVWMLMVEMIVLKDREEWLKNRDRIGGSDASSILGLNPYRSNVELWQIKTGQLVPEDISEKPYVKYGTNAEQHLRELFKLDFPEYQVFYEENNMWLNDKYPFAHASLDGWLIDQDGRKGIWECKTTNILQSMQKEKWNNRIPDNYYIQLLHYFLVTEFEFAVLKAQLKSEFDGEIYLQTKHYKIERSEVEADIKFLESSERKFWKQVQERRRPDLILPEI